MKSIIAIALLIALTSALNLKGEDGLIKFDMEDSESAFGFAMRGHIDPKDELNNKIQAFLKLAGQYIPILESMNSKTNNLSWTRRFTLSLGGLGSIVIDGAFEVVVGWRVFVASGGANSTSDHLDVTYQPFIHGYTGALVQGDTYLARGFYNATLNFVRAQAPISLKVYNTGKVCFSGNGVLLPVQLGTTISASLKGCKAEILTDIIDSLPITLGCGFGPYLNLTHLNQTFTSATNFNVLNYACIG